MMWIEQGVPKAKCVRCGETYDAHKGLPWDWCQDCIAYAERLDWERRKKERGV